MRTIRDLNKQEGEGFIFDCSTLWHANDVETWTLSWEETIAKLRIPPKDMLDIINNTPKERIAGDYYGLNLVNFREIIEGARLYLERNLAV